jgi:putative alpha-1,2-mannosidase
LNGQPYTKTFLRHADIINGGVLEFNMSSTPDTTKQIAYEDKPFSLSR